MHYLAVSALFCSLSAQDATEAVLTVYVNEKKIGDQDALIVGNEIRLPFAFADAALAPLLDEQVYVFLKNRSTTGGFIGATDLRALGFGVEFDELALALRIRVPARLMAINYLGAKSVARRDNIPVKHPSFFSSSLNSSFRATYNHENEADPYALFSETLDGAVNVGGWVAEAEMEIDSEPVVSGGEILLVSDLGRANLVKDFRAIGVRMTAGTVDLPWRGFQSRHSTIGMNLVRNESILYPEARRTALPRAISDTFTIERWARVSVKINGAVVYSTRVETGRYRFADLPYVSGLNEVEIEITESYKNTVRYRIGIPFDSSALREGKVDYALGFGVDEQRRSDPIFSGYANFGLTDTETAGISLQAGYSSVLTSSTISTATFFGLFGFEAAQSLSSTAPGVAGYAASVVYRYSRASRPYAPRLGLKSQLSWPGFSPPAAVPSDTVEDFTWVLSGQIAQATPFGLSLSIAGEVERVAGNQDDLSTQFSLGASAPLGNGATLHSNASLRRRDGIVDRQINISLSIIPWGGRSSTMYRQNLGTGESGANVTISEGRGVGAYSYSVAADNLVGPEDLQPSVGGSVKRTGRFGDLGVSAGVGDWRSGNGASSYLTFSTDNGLVFAEGILSPSRNVNDSFALLAPDPSFGANPVEMKFGSEKAVVEGGGHPIVGALMSAYSDGIAAIDTPGSPPDVSAKESRVRLRPTYKSGIVVRPERTISVYASGRLTDAVGSPVGWVAGRAETADGKIVGDLFTDEDGRFELYELAEGRYKIIWASDNLSPISFDVPPRADGKIDLGTIVGAIDKGEAK